MTEPTRNVDSANRLAAALFGALGLLSSGAWVLFGQGLQRVLTSSRAVRVFNWTMAVLLIASLYPVLWPVPLDSVPH